MASARPETRAGVATYASPREAFRAAARISLGAPSAVLAAGYIGFAALAKAGDFPLWAALLSTATIWALPGQIVMVEMSHSGAAHLLIVFAVALTATRFLPMTLSLMPLLREPQRRPWQLYLAAHILAMTNWALCVRRVPELPPEQRMAYFVGFALSNWLACLAATAAGYGLAGSFSPLVSRSLALVSPLYFLLIMVGETRTRLGIASLALGAAAGPFLYRYSPEWSVLAAGLLGGTLAYFALRGRA